MCWYVYRGNESNHLTVLINDNLYSVQAFTSFCAYFFSEIFNENKTSVTRNHFLCL